MSVIPSQVEYKEDSSGGPRRYPPDKHHCSRLRQVSVSDEETGLSDYTSPQAIVASLEEAD